MSEGKFRRSSDINKKFRALRGKKTEAVGSEHNQESSHTVSGTSQSVLELFLSNHISFSSSLSTVRYWVNIFGYRVFGKMKVGKISDFQM